MIDNKRLARHVHTLIHYRVEDVLDYFSHMTKEKIAFLEALEAQIDGDIERAKALYKQLPKTFNSMYNQYAIEKNAHSPKANLYETMLKKNYPQEFKMHKKTKTNKIAMFIPHLRRTGGMDKLMNMKKILEKMGQTVDLYLQYPYEYRMVSDTLFGENIQFNTYVWDEDIAKIAKEYDGAISSYFDLNHILSQHFKKVLYYAQGDYPTLLDQENNQRWLNAFHRSPLEIVSVSSYLKEVIQKRFNRNSIVVPCGIDLSVFYPSQQEKEPYVIVIGEERIEEKRITQTLEATIQVVENLGIKIVHITPANEKTFAHPLIETKHNLSQTEVASYLRGALCYVQGSFVEGFSLPPLEAMACGTPVVSVNNGGITEYGVHGKNVLLCDRDDFVGLQRELKKVLLNKELQKTLRESGLITAKEYSLEKTNHLLEEKMQQFIQSEPLIKSPF